MLDVTSGIAHEVVVQDEWLKMIGLPLKPIKVFISVVEFLSVPFVSLASWDLVQTLFFVYTLQCLTDDIK